MSRRRLAGRPAATRAARAAAVALVLLLAACGKVELYGQLTEHEANDMLALLLRAGIAAEKAVGKNAVNTLRVASDRVPDAMALLDAAGLPHDRFTNMGELFRREGLISSPSEERVRYIYGITQELARTMTSIDGVLDARVHVVLPNNDPVSGGPARPSTAAVLIRYAPAVSMDSVVPKIKELVANSIEGLSYDRISVVLVRAIPGDTPVGLPALPPPEPLPRATIFIAAGLLGLSLSGNLAMLGLLFWRRRSRASGTVATVP